VLQLIGLFAALFGISFLVFLFFTRASKAEQATLKRAQHITTGKDADSESDPLLIDPHLKTRPLQQGAARHSAGQAFRVAYPAGGLVYERTRLFGLSFAGAVLAFLLSWMLIPILLVEFIALSVGALLPYLYLRFKRERRLAAFDKALPEPWS
jgi:Flp pilus assembly protein TadB